MSTTGYNTIGQSVVACMPSTSLNSPLRPSKFDQIFHMLLACLPYRFSFSFSIFLDLPKCRQNDQPVNLTRCAVPESYFLLPKKEPKRDRVAANSPDPQEKQRKTKRGCLSPKNRKLNILFENHTELSKLLFSLQTCCKLCLYVWSRLTSAPFGTSNDAHANRRAPTALRGDVRRGRLDR